jgi:hypothetical protein
MRRILLGLTLALAVSICSIGAADASAKKTTALSLVSSFSGTPPFSEIASSEDVTLEISEATVKTDLGVITCSGQSDGLETYLGGNGLPTDELVLLNAFGMLEGESFCQSTLKADSLALLYLHATAFHIGTLALNANGKLQIKANEKARLGIYFPGTEVSCFYSFKAMKGTLSSVNDEASPPPELSFPKQKLKYEATKPAMACPKKAEFSFVVKAMKVNGHAPVYDHTTVF